MSTALSSQARAALIRVERAIHDLGGPQAAQQSALLEALLRRRRELMARIDGAAERWPPVG